MADLRGANWAEMARLVELMAAQRIRLLAGEKQQGESRKAVQACNDWLRLGRGRSLPALIEVYTKMSQDAPPTRSLATLKHWSSGWEWDKRAEAYDAELERLKNERRERVMSEGLALVHERTDELKQLAQFLLRQLYDQDTGGKYYNLWLKDAKQIGSGENAKQVDIERFNSALIEQLRGALDDLAKETGGRKQQQKLETLNLDLTALSNEQLERIAAGEDPVHVLATSGQGGTGTPSAGEG